jgi:HPt (histidine-containing phosphotransfer) domain-containing protein
VKFPDGLEPAVPLRDQRCLPDDAVPVLDPVPLMDMLDDVGDRAARKFVDEYLELLPQRVSWIVTALATGDPEEPLDALRSLKSTSGMIGALRLEDYCRRLKDRLAAGVLPDARSVGLELSAQSQLIIPTLSGN